MKTAISIPVSIFKAADRFAQRLGMSRSELYSKALAEYLKKHNNERVTQKLDEIYEKETSHLDSVLQKLQSASFSEDEW